MTTRPVLSHRLIHEEKIKLATSKSKVSQMKKLFQSFTGEMEDSMASPSHGGASAVRLCEPSDARRLCGRAHPRAPSSFSQA